MNNDLSQKKKQIENLKSEAMRTEERVKMLTQQKEQLEQECKQLGVDPNKLNEVVIDLEKQLNEKMNELSNLMEEMK